MHLPIRKFFRTDLKSLKITDTLDQFSEAISILDNKGFVIFINTALAKLLNVDRETWLAEKRTPPFPVKAGQTIETEITFTLPRFLASIDCSILPVDGKSFLLARVRDISMEREKELEIQNGLERYKLAFQCAQDGLWDWDLQSNKIFLSMEWKSMIGVLYNEISDNPEEWFKRVHDDDINRLKSTLFSHLNGDTEHFECHYRLLHKDFSYRWMLCRGTALRDTKKKAYRITGMQVDITNHKQSEEQLVEALDDLKFALASEKVLFEELDKKNKELTELSITDGLTKLFNHRYLQERFDFEFNRAKRYGISLSCLLIDIDHFKQINDTYGHQYGDYVLRELSRLFKTLSRDVDICGRYGGEEFMIITNLSIDDAMKFGTRINKSVAGHTFADNNIVTCVTVSIGVAEYKSDIKTKHELIEHTDTALYQAKHEGRNCIRQWREQEETEEIAIDRFSINDLKDKFTQLSNKMRTTYIDSTNALVNAIDAKDHYTREHSQNVSRYAAMLGTALKLPEKVIETLRNASLLHDVGKIGIPQEILIKKEKLNSEEYELLKQHPVIGINILKDVKFLEKETPIILHHHERVDGKGYPHGLKGYEIPLGARILAVVDSYDAMTTDREYQKKISKEEALEELKRCSGKQFSQEIVDAFVKAMSMEED